MPKSPIQNAAWPLTGLASTPCLLQVLPPVYEPIQHLKVSSLQSGLCPLSRGMLVPRYGPYHHLMKFLS